VEIIAPPAFGSVPIALDGYDKFNVISQQWCPLDVDSFGKTKDDHYA
jgi:hypothetical protein